MTRSKATVFPDLQPTPRELRWFAHIDRHGPQSSAFLYEMTHNTHICQDTALRRLQALRDAKYLRLPHQQHQTYKADFNPYIYDLTAKGSAYLNTTRCSERHTRPSGHWWHGLWVSSISSAIDITAYRAGLEYIPAARILGIKDVPMAIPMAKGKVIPDQIFAIKYLDGYRAFALEVDRGTEPVRSQAARKSLARSVSLYREILHQKLHQRHFGLKSNLIVLWMFMSIERQKQFDDLLAPDDPAFRTGVCLSNFPHWTTTMATAQSLLGL